MAGRYETLVSVLRLLVEENLKSGRWKDPRPPEFTRADIVDAEFRDGAFYFTLAGGRSWFARPDELNASEINELLDWAEVREVESRLESKG